MRRPSTWTPSFRTSDTPFARSANGWSDGRDRRVARDRNRSQHGGLQRRQRASAQAASVSGSRPAGRALAPVTGHQHSAGLAVTGPIHRREERESIVRRAVDLAGSQWHDRCFPKPQPVEGLLTSSSLFHLLGAKALHGRLLRPDEDRPGPAGSSCSATVLETRVQRGSQHRRQDDQADQHRRLQPGERTISFRWSASSTRTFC